MPHLFQSQSSSGDNLLRGMLLSTDTLAADAFSPPVGASGGGFRQQPPSPRRQIPSPRASREATGGDIDFNLGRSPPAEELAPELAFQPSSSLDDGGGGEREEEERPSSPTFASDDAYDMASALRASLSPRSRGAPASEPRPRRGSF